jgi:hypothetical protein
MRALAEHALLLSEAEYRSVHRELDAGDSYHRHLALHYATVRRDIPEVVRALDDPVLRRRALSVAMRLPVPDQALAELVDTAPRRDRLLVYGLLKRSRRRALADALLPKVFECRGRVEASRLLPACSPTTVDEWLPRTGADLSVRRQLVRVVPKTVLALISDDLRRNRSLLDALVLREPEAVGEFVARHPHLCRSARLAIAALKSTSDVRSLWRHIGHRERHKALAMLPMARRRELIDRYSTVDELATLPLDERRALVAGRDDLLAALPFSEVSERLLRATRDSDFRSRAVAWHGFLTCAARTGDPEVFASAVAYSDRAWHDMHMVRSTVLECLADAPRRLLDAVPESLWQWLTNVISSAIDNSRRTWRAFRRLSDRIGTMTEQQAVELVRRNPRDRLKPAVWDVIARRRTDLVDGVLDASWPGPTSATGRWNPMQRARYEEQAAKLARDEAVEIGVRVAAARMIRDQGVLTYLVDRAPQPIALAAIRGITAEQVLVRCVESWRGPISRVAGQVLADLSDGQLRSISVGGTKEQARLLAETRPPEAVDRLLELWQNGHRDVKAVAAASLATFLGEDPRVSTAVTAAMIDDESAIRQAVLGKPPAILTHDQSVTLARLTFDAIRPGRPDVIGAYGNRWRLAPDGFGRVIEQAGGPYTANVSSAVVSAIWAALNTETGDRAALSLVDRIIEADVDVRRWLEDCQPLARGIRSERVIGRLVEVFLQAGMIRAAATLLYQTAVRTLDLTWWRELVRVVGERPDRLGERDYARPRQWDEDAAVDILDELSRIGGYVPAKLTVRLVRIGGLETEWTRPWRERLGELQAHQDIDIRELAAAVRIP